MREKEGAKTRDYPFHITSHYIRCSTMGRDLHLYFGKTGSVSFNVRPEHYPLKDYVYYAMLNELDTLEFFRAKFLWCL